MEIRERKFDVILLDVDGTLLDFGMSEKLSLIHICGWGTGCLTRQ